MKFDNYDLVQPMRFFIRVLKCLGLWRLDNKWEPYYRAYSYCLHFFVSFLTLASMWTSVLTSKSIEEFFESLYMSLTEAAFMAKLINVFHLSREAVNFFVLVEDEALRLRCFGELKIFEREQRVFNFFLKFYLFASVSALLASFSVVGLGSKWVLPYPAWMPFELESEFYWYGFTYQMSCMTITCLANVSLDTLQCYFLHHVSLIYRVIGYRLEHVGSDLGHVTGDEAEKLFHRDFVQIVNAHMLSKRLKAECERFVSFPFFTQILLSVLVLCFTGYQLSETSALDNPGQFFGTVDFLFVMSLQIFLPCYFAERVTTQAEQLGGALYNSNWTPLPKKSKRLIYLYMEFLKEPVIVKAGNYFSIGLPIFSKIVNNAYSFFALLLRMRE